MPETDLVELPGKPSCHTLLSVTTVAALTTTTPSAVRRWSRKIIQSTPPPLPLISLPPDDDWEEFDVPAKTGFAYTLPDLMLEHEETQDASATTAPAPSSFTFSSSSSTTPSNSSTTRKPTLPHDRAAICRILSEYMAQNEVFQVRRHGFGIDTTLVYKRNKSSSSSSSHKPSASGDELAFDALFESGNLDRAYRVLGRHYATPHELLGGISTSTSTSTTTATGVWSSPFPFFVKADLEYDLYCDADVSTHGHIQWYYFRATIPSSCCHRSSSSSSSSQLLRVRLNLRNMLKSASLYNDGMLPAVYTDARGWHHAGVNVCYFKNADTYRNRKTGKLAHWYTLSFVYEFHLLEEDPVVRVAFAHCYPYPYSRLQRYLLSLQKDPDRSRVLRRRVLCKTIAGNICDVLTITDFSQEDDTRTGVIFTARVHPGESNASFIMHGLLDFLTGPSCEARFLRHRFVFKIVPMLNPDGVIHGNYRCSLAGTDLNRRYTDPSPELHPTVYATKAMVLSMAKTRVVSLYCDLHGHSRKKNMFLYGCVPLEDDGPGSTNTATRQEAARLRLFPHVLSKTCSFYSFPDCTFSVSKSKRGTGRVVVWQDARVLHSFTLEASFFGVGVNKKRHALGVVPVTNQQAPTLHPIEYAMTHFMPQDLRSAGQSLGLSLIPFSRLLDRDKPTPSPSPPLTSGDWTVRAFSLPVQPTLPPGAFQVDRSCAAAAALAASPRETIDSKTVRLVPLPPLSGAVQTPFLHTRSPLTKPTASPPLPTSDFLTMDALLTSLPSTDDLLREIEETLPEHFTRYDDSDDDGASPGSESDPSGDNMEVEELQRQDSWKDLRKESGSDPSSTSSTRTSPQDALPPPAKLTRHRSQSMLKRFSDSMLRLAMAPDDLLVPTQPVDPLSTQSPEPAKPTPLMAPLTEPAKAKPSGTLGPVRAPTPSTLVRRTSGTLSSSSSLTHPRDRNQDIAALHLRAVQRRSRTKRTSQRLVIAEHELL